MSARKRTGSTPAATHTPKTAPHPSRSSSLRSSGPAHQSTKSAQAIRTRPAADAASTPRSTRATQPSSTPSRQQTAEEEDEQDEQAEDEAEGDERNEDDEAQQQQQTAAHEDDGEGDGEDEGGAEEEEGGGRGGLGTGRGQTAAANQTGGATDDAKAVSASHTVPQQHTHGDQRNTNEIDTTPRPAAASHHRSEDCYDRSQQEESTRRRRAGRESPAAQAAGRAGSTHSGVSSEGRGAGGEIRAEEQPEALDERRAHAIAPPLAAHSHVSVVQASHPLATTEALPVSSAARHHSRHCDLCHQEAPRRSSVHSRCARRVQCIAGCDTVLRRRRECDI